ncbi:MAG: DUF5908 family protein [Segatella oris]|jgi:hypothetical protein|uniref:DUF5908 family protein n=1 Tax=Prevotellaceae TaxID=171552 RepID=UPI001319BF94|nr:DUF5908 family protein [Prevotella koreensis]
MAIKINELVIRATIEKERSSRQAENENASEMVLTPEKTIELQSFNKLNRER